MNIVPVDPMHFPAITFLLKTRFAQNSGVPPDWSRVFQYSWRKPEDPVGFIALDGREPLGFIGTVISYQHDSRGQLRRWCNLTSWTAVPKSRTAGALLLKEALSLDCSFTNLTSAPQLVQPMLKLGFKIVDSQAAIVSLASVWRPEYRQISSEVVSKPEQIRAVLNGPCLQVFIHHLNLPCHQLAMVSEHGTCHVLYNFRKGKLFNYAHIQHISHPEIFASDLRGLLTHLFIRHRIARVVVEPRWLKARLPGGTTLMKLHSPRMLRAELDPAEASNGYTEMTLLNLV